MPSGKTKVNVTTTDVPKNGTKFHELETFDVFYFEKDMSRTFIYLAPNAAWDLNKKRVVRNIEPELQVTTLKAEVSIEVKE